MRDTRILGQTMASRIEMDYGEPGSGKSSGIAYMIAKIFRDTGKHFRVFVGDGSAATYIDWGLVDIGAVHLVDYTIRDWPLSVTQQITEGLWPSDPEDPKSPMRRLTSEETRTLAGWVFEGTSVMSNYIMGHKKGGLAEQAGRGVKIGQDSPIMIRDCDTTATGAYDPKTGTGMVFGGNPVAHYNVAQRHMLTNIERTKQLPGLVFWTAHERVATDSTTSEKVIGPEVAGSALSPGLSRYFNNTRHHTVATRSVKAVDGTTGKSVSGIFNEFRLYTRDHSDPDGLTLVKYKAVVRTPRPDLIKDYYTSTTPGKNLSDFYDDLQAAKEAQLSTMSASV